jgi:peptidoglycan/xylan/chitin deacetylase (PgdA/CDA1 family)
VSSISNPPNRGRFVVSLDFELNWGIRDKISLPVYRDRLLGARVAIPKILSLFRAYGIHATWATVGLLFFETKTELLRSLPSVRPTYANRKLSPYADIGNIGHDEQRDPFHFAPSLIQAILATQHQEIGTHTFSHYYCLEPGQGLGAFSADLNAAIAVAARFDVVLRSLVFPRNQFNRDYLKACRDRGIVACRGNQRSRMYHVGSGQEGRWRRRLLRSLDSYADLSGPNGYSVREIAGDLPMNTPASRFLRPRSRLLRLAEPIRLRRILQEMTSAANNCHVYHLWWHPHNFGVDMSENLEFLEQVLRHYAELATTGGMDSMHMSELAMSLQPSKKAPHARKQAV